VATNSFFQNYDYSNEQSLIDDLVIESIQIYGLDMAYITRSIQSVDEILNEDDLSIFNAAYSADMYVKSIDGFQGEGDSLVDLDYRSAIKQYLQLHTEHLNGLLLDRILQLQDLEKVIWFIFL